MGFDQAKHLDRVARLCADRAFNRRITWIKDYPTDTHIFKFPEDARWLLGKIKDSGSGGIAHGLLEMMFKDRRPDLRSPDKALQRHVRLLKQLGLVSLKDYKGKMIK